MRENIALNTKAIIYIVFFIAVGVLCIRDLSAEPGSVDDFFPLRDYYMEATDPDSESSDFWPPDMVPHPILPGDGPKDNSGGELA